MHLNSEPVHRLRYCGISQDRRTVVVDLPILLGHVDSLPSELDALVVTADLQGRSCEALADGSRLLLGEALAQEFNTFERMRLLPRMDRLAVVLGGDFFARPQLDRRGGLGDVRSVWRAFAQRARWVVGVAGNHDVFGDKPSVQLPAFLQEPGIHLLTCGRVDLDGLAVAGLSGIIGPPRKPMRHDEKEYVNHVRHLAMSCPNLLVLHDGPDAVDPPERGYASVRNALEEMPPTLVVRGHKHWDQPVAHFANGTQVLNVHERAVILNRTPR